MKSTTPTIGPTLDWLCADQGIAILILDGHQSITAANPPAQTLLGYSEAQLCETGLEGLGVQDDIRLQSLLQGPPGPACFSCHFPIFRRDGQKLGVSATAYHASDGRYLLKLERIDGSESAVETMRQNEERYRIALEAAGIGTWDMDIKKNQTRRSLLHEQCFGYSQLQKHWSYETFLSHIVEEDRAKVDSAYKEAMAGGGEYDIRFRVRWPDQSTHWLWSKGQFYLDEQGNPDHVAGIQADVTEEVNLREELRYQATHDYLTKLCNRNCFEASLSKLLESPKTESALPPVAVILIDVDHFKRFNDAFNHLGGDLVLKAIADRIRENVTSEMLTARFGGDEFVIAVPGATPDSEFFNWVSGLIKAFSQKLPLEQSWVQPTVSMGVSFSPDHGTTALELLRSADTAMYDAKRCGRATFRVSNSLDRLSGINTLLLADQIPDALDAGEICLYYQPQFAISDHRLIGMEALLRWLPPDRPGIAPDQLVAAAEQSGFISELGDWVVQESCRQIQEWRSLGLKTVPIAINVSGVQFLRGQLTENICRRLAQHRLSGDCLEIEITESIALHNTEDVLSELHELRRAGLGIAIDDFGTGFSSLSYLRHFPVNRIKIDRSFVNGCLDIQENAAICRTIISLAHNLGCQVIAEGVETSEQLDFLLQQGCEEVQGYLLAKPMPADAAQRFLEPILNDSVQPKSKQHASVGWPKKVDDTPAVPETFGEMVRLRSVREAKRHIDQHCDRLNRIVEMTAKALGVSMASLNLIEADTVTTLVPYGLPVGTYPRSEAFCDQTIRQIDILEIPDAREHPHFRHSSSVKGPPGIRFYAGLGILAPNHQMIGTLCMFDHQPHELDPLEKNILANMGAMIESELARYNGISSDSASSIKNRREFSGCLRISWYKASRTDSPQSLIWLGIDQLEDINAKHGLETGDQCLLHVLTLVSAFSENRGNVDAFRMEGDSFALLCREASDDKAQILIGELKQAFENANTPGLCPVSVPFTVSVGSHSSRSNGSVASMDQFVSRARQALYVAKTNSTNRLEVRGTTTKTHDSQPSPQ